MSHVFPSSPRTSRVPTTGGPITSTVAATTSGAGIATEIITAAFLIATAGMVATPTPVSAQQNTAALPTITYHYISRGGDTIGTETVTHIDGSVNGVLSLKGQPRIEWDQAVTNGKPGVLTMRVFAPGAAATAAPLQSGTVETRGDSVAVDFLGGAQRTKQTLASKTRAFPLVNASVLHAALLVSYAQMTKQTSVNMFLTSGAQTLTGTIARQADTTVFSFGNTGMRIVPAADGMPNMIDLTGQGAYVVRANSSAAAPPVAREAARINYDAPAGAPYTATHVRIPSGRGYELAATLTMPKGVTKSAVVVTISGSGPQERDSRISLVKDYAFFRLIADTLGKSGIATLRFDDRAVGESGGRDGASAATSADVADDVRAIIAWLRARADIDASRIILAGHSEGGMVAPMIAATDPQLRGIAIMAGTAFTGRTILMFQNQQAVSNAPGLSRAQRDSIMATVPAQLDSLGKTNPWINYFMSYDPIPTAKRVKQPVLILQGATDLQVTPEQADSLAVAIRSNGNSHVTLRKFPDTNHLFLHDTSGMPQKYSTLTDPKVGNNVLGTLVDWVISVAK